MNILKVLVKRNIKLFFKDKGMFFTALVTPAILLVLYSTFLGNVYHDSLLSFFPEGINVQNTLIDSFVGAQLVSSILSVSCVTVSFCSNMLMISDKANQTIKDFTVSPVKPAYLAMSYYISTFISALCICLTAAGIGLIYMKFTGWYLIGSDILFLLLDIVLLVMFGTALSSIIHFFLQTQGQMSAVGTIVSAGYGFICGAYMPISQFSEGLQKILLFFPATYGTSLVRNHTMRGIFEEMTQQGFPAESIQTIKKSMDCNLYFRERLVSVSDMYLILSISVIVLICIYIMLQKRFSFQK